MKSLASFAVVLIFSLLSNARTSFADIPEWAADIDKVLDAKGAYSAKEDAHKVSFPRADLTVKVDKTAMPPFMGFTSWAAFTPAMDKKTMMMGDLVLFQDEVNLVIDTLFKNNMMVTALHNHFFYSDPTVFFMHMEGNGNHVDLANGVKAVMQTIKQYRIDHKDLASGFEGDTVTVGTLSSQTLADILGAGAASPDGKMFKASFGRNIEMSMGPDAQDKEMMPVKVGNTMGVNTWAAILGSDKSALVDGDFAILETEMEPVFRSLRKAGINIVAIHSHMRFENPRMLFMHYWGKGEAATLAKAVKEALAYTPDSNITKAMNGMKGK
jgi:hypothetical protein